MTWMRTELTRKKGINEEKKVGIWRIFYNRIGQRIIDRNKIMSLWRFTRDSRVRVERGISTSKC